MLPIKSAFSQETSIYYIPSSAIKDTDVLCGRGGLINTHVGNEAYRVLVNTKKRVYLTARFKKEKRIIVQSVINRIRSTGGRFLSRKEVPRRGRKKLEDEMWFEISDDKAREKIGQALREDAPRLRKTLMNKFKEGESQDDHMVDDNNDDYEGSTADHVNDQVVTPVRPLPVNSMNLTSPDTSRRNYPILPDLPACYLSPSTQDQLNTPPLKRETTTQITQVQQSYNQDSTNAGLRHDQNFNTDFLTHNTEIAHHNRSVNFVHGVNLNTSRHENQRNTNDCSHLQASHSSTPFSEDNKWLGKTGNMQIQNFHHEKTEKYQSLLNNNDSQKIAGVTQYNSESDFQHRSNTTKDIYLSEPPIMSNFQNVRGSSKFTRKSGSDIPRMAFPHQHDHLSASSTISRINSTPFIQPPRNYKDDNKNHRQEPDVASSVSFDKFMDHSPSSGYKRQEMFQHPTQQNYSNHQLVPTQGKKIIEASSTMIEQRVDHDAKGQGCEAWISHEWNLPVCCGGLAHTTSNDSRDVFIDNMEITSSGSLGGTSLCNVFDDEKRSARVCRPLEGDERSQSSPLDQSNGTRSIDMLNSTWDNSLVMKFSDIASPRSKSPMSVSSVKSDKRIVGAEYKISVDVPISPVTLKRRKN